MHERRSISIPTPTQFAAVEAVSARAKVESEAAYPKLLKRIKDVKPHYGEYELKKLLLYVKDDAEIIIHFRGQRTIAALLNDSLYRSQFETNTSCGLLSRPARMTWEDRLFGASYNSAPDRERVKYGCLNTMNCSHGVSSAFSYGRSFFVLHDHMRARCTITPSDSCRVVPIGTLAHCCHVLVRMSKLELASMIKVAMGTHVCKPSMSAPHTYAYKEIQIHSSITLAGDIARLVIADRDLKAHEQALIRLALNHRIVVNVVPRECQRSRRTNSTKILRKLHKSEFRVTLTPCEREKLRRRSHPAMMMSSIPGGDIGVAAAPAGVPRAQGKGACSRSSSAAALKNSNTWLNLPPPLPPPFPSLDPCVLASPGSASAPSLSSSSSSFTAPAPCSSTSTLQSSVGFCISAIGMDMSAAHEEETEVMLIQHFFQSESCSFSFSDSVSSAPSTLSASTMVPVGASRTAPLSSSLQYASLQQLPSLPAVSSSLITSSGAIRPNRHLASVRPDRIQVLPLRDEVMARRRALVGDQSRIEVNSAVGDAYKGSTHRMRRRRRHRPSCLVS